MIVTPQQIEKRLVDLSKEIDESQKFLDSAEEEYYIAKAQCEVKLAEERLNLAKGGVKMTIQEKEDVATVACQNYIFALAVSEAKVRAARSNASRIRTQVDIARSIGTSVRSALEL